MGLSLPFTWSGNVLHGIAILCPLVMAILSQQPGTKFWRVRIYPVGIVAAVLAILRLREYARKIHSPGDTSDSFIALYADSLLVYNVSIIGLYAFSDEVYQPHPVPYSVRWRKLRYSRVYRILDIFLSFDRKLNCSPNPPLIAKKTGLLYTFKWACIHSFLVDLFTLPIVALKNYGLYNEDGTRNVHRWCATLAAEFGVPVLFVRFVLFWCYAGTLFSGLQGGWEIAKIIGVGSGLWAEEEWVEIMDYPHLSTSMLEFWGKRYHQLMRSQFHTILTPFQLSKAAYLLASFTLSALHHVLVMSCLTGEFPLHYFQVFIGCGCICLLEYNIYKVTGRKVKGLTGWVWTIIWLPVLGSYSVESEVDSGGFEGFRMPVEIYGWSVYPLDYLVMGIKWWRDSRIV